jgi:hypothetical protein
VERWWLIRASHNVTGQAIINWQQDLLFVLKQEQDGYEFCQKQMTECDRQLNQYLE